MSKELRESELDTIYHEISGLVKRARENVLKSVNYEQVVAYWHIGHKIVEEEQEGEDRSDYGMKLLPGLSEKLTQEFGRGFGVTNLKYMRQFYLKYQHVGIESNKDSITISNVIYDDHNFESGFSISIY